MENKVQVKQPLTVGMPRGFGDWDLIFDSEIFCG